MVVEKKSPLLKHGYMLDRNGQAVPKPNRPTSIGDARKLIIATFEKQGEDGWSFELQQRYFEGKGLGPTSVDKLTADEIRLVIAEMEGSHMLLFRD